MIAVGVKGLSQSSSECIHGAWGESPSCAAHCSHTHNTAWYGLLHIFLCQLSMLMHRRQKECGQPAMLVYAAATEHTTFCNVLITAELGTMPFANDALMLLQLS